MSKTNPGRFFEDYRLGQVIPHAVPRTVSGGERALYHALYPARGALHSSDEFARACGLPQSPMDDLIAFHTVFGKSVPDISLNAVANLGYAQGRWLAPVWPGDTLTAQSEVIGLKENSNRRSGVVWVRTTGQNQHGGTVLDYVRWVMVRKRDADAPAPETVIPDLAPSVAPGELSPAGRVPSGPSGRHPGDAQEVESLTVSPFTSLTVCSKRMVSHSSRLGRIMVEFRAKMPRSQTSGRGGCR